MPTPTKAVMTSRMPDDERRKIENEINSELSWCDAKGTRFDLMLGRKILSKADFDFAWSYPPLEELRLEDVPWPSVRFSIRIKNPQTEAWVATYYFSVNKQADPFTHNMSGEPCKQLIGFAFRDPQLKLITGARMPGIAFAEFVQAPNGTWTHFQYCFDESLESDGGERAALYKTMLTQLFICVKVLTHPEFRPVPPPPAR